MITIVALGNPGPEYTNTRHNVGWLVMQSIIAEQNLPSLVNSSQYTAQISEGVLHGEEVGIVLPTTFMNKSGVSVKKYLEKCGQGGELVVVHDDIDLPFGTIKISRDRGAGGHNGVRSIISSCGSTDFIRIRVGIGHVSIFGVVRRPTGEKLSEYVLGTFKPAEMRKLPTISEKVGKALKVLIEKGLEKAMQECN